MFPGADLAPTPYEPEIKHSNVPKESCATCNRPRVLKRTRGVIVAQRGCTPHSPRRNAKMRADLHGSGPSITISKGRKRLGLFWAVFGKLAFRRPHPAATPISRKIVPVKTT